MDRCRRETEVVQIIIDEVSRLLTVHEHQSARGRKRQNQIFQRLLLRPRTRFNNLKGSVEML